MNKKSKSIKTFALALALGAALLFPVPLSAQHGFDNEWFGGASSGNPIGNQSFGVSNQVWFGNQTFGALSSDAGLFGNQTFGALSSDGGLFGNQTFGGWFGGDGNFNNQNFGDNAPLGNGLTILLIAGAGYAFYKKQRTNNKQQTLEK